MYQARRIGPKFLLQACVVMLCMAASCDACGDPTSESDDCTDFDPAQGCLDAEAAHINLTLRNTSSQNVHLFLDEKDEDFPCCQVGPALQRTIPAYRFKNGASITVSSGRNGTRLDTETCQLQQSEFTAQQKTITWNDGWSC